MAKKLESVRTAVRSLLVATAAFNSVLIALSLSFAPHEEQYLLLQILSAILLPFFIAIILMVAGAVAPELFVIEMAGMYGIIYNTAFGVFYFLRIVSSTVWVFSSQIVLNYTLVVPIQVRLLTLIPCLLSLFMTEPLIRYLEINSTRYLKLSRAKFRFYRISFVLVLFLSLYFQPALWGGLLT